MSCIIKNHTFLNILDLKPSHWFHDFEVWSERVWRSLTGLSKWFLADDAGKCWANSCFFLCIPNYMRIRNVQNKIRSSKQTWHFGVEDLKDLESFWSPTPSPGAPTKWASQGKCARDTHLALHSSGTWISLSFHGISQLAGWFLSWTKPSINGWWLGVPHFKETTIMMGYRSNYLMTIHAFLGCLMFKQTHTGHTICKQTAPGLHIMKRYHNNLKSSTSSCSHRTTAISPEFAQLIKIPRQQISPLSECLCSSPWNPSIFAKKQHMVYPVQPTRSLLVHKFHQFCIDWILWTTTLVLILKKSAEACVSTNAHQLQSHLQGVHLLRLQGSLFGPKTFTERHGLGSSWWIQSSLTPQVSRLISSTTILSHMPIHRHPVVLPGRPFRRVQHLAEEKSNDLREDRDRSQRIQVDWDERHKHDWFKTYKEYPLY